MLLFHLRSTFFRKALAIQAIESEFRDPLRRGRTIECFVTVTHTVKSADGEVTAPVFEQAGSFG
jgi:hypothetical protein